MFKSCVALFVLSSVVVLEAHRVDYSGYKVLSIKPKTEADLILLHKLGKHYSVDLWNEPRQTEINVMTHLKPNVEEVLREHKIEYDVSLSDVNSVIDSERILLAAATNASDEAPFKFGNYNQYNAVNKKMIALMEGLSAQYPSIAKLSTIVKSYKSHPIYNLRRKAGDSTSKATNMMDYGLHAREWSPVAAGDNKIILTVLCLSLLVLFCEAGGKGKGHNQEELIKKESKEEDSKEEQDLGEDESSTTSSSTGGSTTASSGMKSTTESGNELGSSNGTESSGSSNGTESSGSSNGT